MELLLSKFCLLLELNLGHLNPNSVHCLYLANGALKRGEGSFHCIYIGIWKLQCLMCYMVAR
jgi:hypothetical protein